MVRKYLRIEKNVVNWKTWDCFQIFKQAFTISATPFALMSFGISSFGIVECDKVKKANDFRTFKVKNFYLGVRVSNTGFNFMPLNLNQGSKL